MGIYLVVVNVVAWVCFGVDKRRARKGQWRISEATLLTLAAIGGAFGAQLGMTMFRHKTRHLKFRILVPLLALLWAVGLIYLYGAAV